jgi:hypothetical protein
VGAQPTCSDFATSSANLWQAYQLGRELRCRPSDLYALTDPVQRFCFDRAVVIFGSALTHELENAKGKTDRAIAASRRKILAKWIPEATDSSRKRNLRDPSKQVQL